MCTGRHGGVSCLADGIPRTTLIPEDKMKQDQKMAQLGEAAKFMRKAADIIDKIAGAEANEGEAKQGKKKRICD